MYREMGLGLVGFYIWVKTENGGWEGKGGVGWVCRWVGEMMARRARRGAG